MSFDYANVPDDVKPRMEDMLKRAEALVSSGLQATDDDLSSAYLSALSSIAIALLIDNHGVNVALEYAAGTHAAVASKALAERLVSGCGDPECQECNPTKH